MARTVHIVPHTHWDREWYRSYQTFRMQLVDLLDDLLPAMAGDVAYAHFMLDGQMAVVDDYLAIRPEAEPLVRRLAAAGRISMGPWYILMDEFLVSGETMIRNLQLGLDKAAAFGGAMEVGYLPDMFGHIAQMPQLLRGFGFDQTVVWRGVPSVLDQAAFRWEAPDGSAVRAAYLATGYSNGAMLPADAKDLVGLIDGWCHEQGAMAGDPVLWMNGTDHLLPQAHLGRVVAEANALQDDYDLSVSSLAAHLAAAVAADADRSSPMPTWRGELRSGFRSNLLMGVTSNRVDIRRAEARTTQLLEQVAEPLAALYLPADRWPAAFLADAWLEVVRNSAHDSICACSVDEVGRAVIHRYDEAEAIAQGITDRALAAISVAAWPGGDEPVVVNPTARTRHGLVELSVKGDDPVPGTQVLEVKPGRRTLTVNTRGEVENMAAAAIANMDDLRGGVVEEDAEGILTVTLVRQGSAAVPGEVDVDSTLDALHAAVAAGPAASAARLDLVGAPRQRVLARVEVPGFGWARWQPNALDVVEVVAGPTSLDNGILRVEVDATVGTWSVDGQAGFGRLVEEGDVGDTYNWCPTTDAVEVDSVASTTVELVEDGPLRSRLAITTTHDWPAGAEGGRRVGTKRIDVVTTLELRAGEDFVRVAHDVDNRSEDHRLRVWLPLPEPADRSRAESPFTVVERGLTAEGGACELGLPTFPSRRFVQAGGLTVVHEGVAEYELVDVQPTDAGERAHAIALTVLRATGLISQVPMTTRPVPAGPQIATPAAQMPGHQRFAYAVHVGARDPFALADDVLVPLLPARARPGAVGLAGLAIIAPPVAPGALDASAAQGTALRVDGAEVSAVVRTDGRVSVRVFNPHDDDTTVRIEGRKGWLVDLRGRAEQPFEGSFALRAQGIATAVLDD